MYIVFCGGCLAACVVWYLHLVFWLIWFTTCTSASFMGLINLDLLDDGWFVALLLLVFAVCGIVGF